MYIKYIFKNYTNNSDIFSTNTLYINTVLDLPETVKTAA